MSLCESKRVSALRRFCVILDQSQVITLLAKGKDISGVALVTLVVSTIFTMVITLLMMTRSWGEMVFNWFSLQYRQNDLVSKIQTWCEELTAHWVRPLFQHHLHTPTQNRHTPSDRFHRLLILVGLALCLKKIWNLVAQIFLSVRYE